MGEYINEYEFIISDDLQGTRLDVVLSLNLEEVSRSYIQRLIEKGHVILDDGICTAKNHKVKAGQHLQVNLPEPEALKIEKEDIPIEIVYEDEWVLVVNKPKGMVVHPAAGNLKGTLVNAILYHCDTLSSINGVIRPGIVHRIDKDTSGLLLVAKNDIAHRHLADQFARHSIARSYRAIVYNGFSAEGGTVRAPIGRDPKNRLRMAVTAQNGKEAVTHYRVLAAAKNFSYIEAKLETGRTHQIRVHMAHINHPLLGDQVYGPQKKMLGAESQVLHAKTLGFIHPKTEEYMEFDSELPEEFKKILRKLEINE